MRDQYLDSMDLERERGITIKLQSVRLDYRDHVIDLIDTPGHVDFGYEVSRSLAACEGVILLVDAAQGIEAQTLANCYLALEHDLEIVAALNKIDLPAADPDRYAAEIEKVLGIPADQILRISAKTGEGVPELLDAVIERVPPPTGDPDAPLQALIFDSHYDPYRGVVSSVRVVNGNAHDRQPTAVHAGRRRPRRRRGRRAHARQHAGGGARPGRDRLPHRRHQGRGRGPLGRDGHRGGPPRRRTRCAGYQDPKPMVFCGLYPIDGDQFTDLRESLEKLRLNDASFTYEPETSGALGFGFRCGFLGLLHMEIVRERLEREFDLSLIATAPSVAYQVHTDRRRRSSRSTTRPPCPPAQEIDHIEEPFLTCTILTPTDYTGTLMELCQQRRGRDDPSWSTSRPSASSWSTGCRWPRWCATSSTSSSRARRATPASTTSPPATTAPTWSRSTCCSTAWPPTPFSAIVHKDKAYDYGRRMAEKLRELIPRQLFDVPIQAAIGGRIISRETVKAKRKDVLAKCYGGDITRKRKLLERQKEGKKRMKSIGRVEVPQEAFISALKLDD